MELQCAFFKMKLDDGVEIVKFDEPHQENIALDSVTLRLRHSGIANLELIYMGASDQAFTQVFDSLLQDARAIGASITLVAEDFSEFLMETGDVPHAFSHHHYLFKIGPCVLHCNFFQNVNERDVREMKEMLKKVVIVSNPLESSFDEGRRIPLGSQYEH